MKCYRDMKLAKNVSCKSSDVIYIQLCEHCTSGNAYVGQTAKKFSDRISGHRSRFNVEHYEESALSYHSYLEHGQNVNLNDFNF